MLDPHEGHHSQLCDWIESDFQEPCDCQNYFQPYKTAVDALEKIYNETGTICDGNEVGRIFEIGQIVRRTLALLRS